VAAVPKVPPQKLGEKKRYAIAQAVSHRFPNAAAGVRFQARSYGICGGQSGAGIGFLSTSV
jgi:hypothetical protein